MALQIIGAGLGRTGTLSLKLALERLGFAKCYHMSEVMAGGHFGLWVDAAGGTPDWEAIFDGFAATTDYPACGYWRELADHYPDAKVILTLRDPDSWWESTRATIFSETVEAMIAGAPPMVRTMFEAVLPMAMIRAQRDDCAAMTAYFRAHNQAVIDGVAADRLLQFDVRQGWGPLCAFLGVDAPDEPFPRVNERGDLAKRFSETSEPGAGISEAELSKLAADIAADARRATETPVH